MEYFKNSYYWSSRVFLKIRLEIMEKVRPPDTVYISNWKSIGYEEP